VGSVRFAYTEPTKRNNNNRLLAQANDELDELKINNDVMTRMKRWMIDILKRFGFWAVLGFSAYPNAAFDLVRA